MKAIVITQPETCSLQEIPSKPLKSQEVRIQVKVSCICGSDLKSFKKPVMTPQVPGHEFSGVVTEIGPDSLGHLKIGDRVTAFPMMGCMKCEACAEERFRDCDRKLSLGFHIPGSFADEVIIDERFAVQILPSLSFEEGALVEHLCCGYRLSKEVISHNPNQSSHIVIIGDGPIALADVQAFRADGYQNITLIGKHEFRMNLAKKLGAVRVLKSWDSRLPRIDICIHAAPAPETMESLILSLHSESVIFPQTSFVKKCPQFKIGRAFAYSLTDFHEVMTLIEKGVYQTKGLITQRVPLEEAAETIQNIFFKKDDQFKIAIIPKG